MKEPRHRVTPMPTAALAGVVCAVLMLVAAAGHTVVAAGEIPDDRVVEVPGGVSAVSRMFGHVDPNPDRFVTSLNRSLLRIIRRDGDWEEIGPRRTLVAYLATIRRLRNRFADEIVLEASNGRPGAEFLLLTNFFGYTTGSGGFPYLREAERGPEVDFRRWVAFALGWNLRAASHRIHAGERIVWKIPSDVVCSPVPLTTWRKILGAKRLDRENALEVLAMDQALSLLLASLERVDTDTLAELGGEELRWIHKHAAVPFHRYVAALQYQDGKLTWPVGDGTSEQWDRLAGESVDPNRTTGRQLLNADDGKLAHLWHAMRFAPPEAVEFFMADGDLSRRRRKALMGYFDRLLQIEGSGYFAAGRGSDASLSTMMRTFTDAGELFENGPALLEAWTADARLEDSCLDPRTLEKVATGVEGTSLDPDTMLWRLLTESEGPRHARVLALEPYLRLMRTFRLDQTVLTPETIVLLRRTERLRPCALDLMESIPFHSPELLAAFLRTIEGLDCLADGPERVRTNLAFQAGIWILSRLADSGTLADDACASFLSDWIGIHDAGVGAGNADRSRIEWITRLAGDTAESGPRGGTPVALEQSLLHRITGIRRPGGFRIDGMQFRGDRGAGLASSMREYLDDQGIPALKSMKDGSSPAEYIVDWLVGIVYAWSVAQVDNLSFKQPGLIAHHDLADARDPILGDALPFVSGWCRTEMIRTPGGASGAHLRGCLHDVTGRIVDHHLFSVEPARPEHTRLDVRPWYTTLVRHPLTGLSPATVNLVSDLMAAGTEIIQAVIMKNPREAFERWPVLNRVMPIARLERATLGTEAMSLIAPSERFAVGWLMAGGRLPGLPVSPQFGADLLRKRDPFDEEWQTALDSVGLPTPHLNGRRDGWLGIAPMYESITEESGLDSLRERQMIDVWLSLLEFSGRRHLSSRVIVDLGLKVLERIPEEVGIASERDWEPLLRWLASLSDRDFEEGLRECLRSGYYGRQSS